MELGLKKNGIFSDSSKAVGYVSDSDYSSDNSENEYSAVEVYAHSVSSVLKNLQGDKDNDQQECFIQHRIQEMISHSSGQSCDYIRRWLSEYNTRDEAVFKKLCEYFQLVLKEQNHTEKKTILGKREERESCFTRDNNAIWGGALESPAPKVRRLDMVYNQVTPEKSRSGVSIKKCNDVAGCLSFK